jgi:hypothetical protein
LMSGSVSRVSMMRCLIRHWIFSNKSRLCRRLDSLIYMSLWANRRLHVIPYMNEVTSDSPWDDNFLPTVLGFCFREIYLFMHSVTKEGVKLGERKGRN